MFGPKTLEKIFEKDDSKGEAICGHDVLDIFIFE